MELENEILFKAYGITGYATSNGGMCDDTPSSDRVNDECDDDGKRLDTLDGQYDIRPGSD